MVEPERIYLNPILLLLLLLHGAEAQSAMQQAPPIPSANNWDTSSVAVTMGALILMLLLVTLFSMFLRRCAESYSSRFTEQPRDWPCSCSQPGIPSDLLKTFPVIFYSSAVTGGEATATTLQCAVCLSEFNDGDTLRLLPHCNHVFHTQCIDAWLSSHVTCPVCRANLNRQDFPHVVVCFPDESNSRGRAEGGGEEVAGGDEDVCSGGEARGDAALE